MGCGCAGSTPREGQSALTRQAAAAAAEARPVDPRGPGHPDFYWNGPLRQPATNPAATPAR